jgi:hypothetical protein
MRQRGFLASVVAFLAAAPALQAQVQWNRKVEAIAVVPGATPGDLDIHAAVSVADYTTGTVPSNLSFGLDVVINGTVVDTQTVIATGTPSTPADSCGGVCGARKCVCVELAGGTVCGCNVVVITVPADRDEAPAPGDEITVILYPAPGALPEQDQSDDVAVAVLGGGPILWNRQIVSVEIEPAASLGASFFDIVVVLCEEIAGAVGPSTDLSSEVDVLVDGALQASVPVDLSGVAWSTCGSPCAGACAFAGGGVVAACKTDPALGCLCAMLPFGVTIKAVPVPPGDEITVILRPAPGGLPELPGFGDDDEHTVPGCPGDCGNGDHVVDVVDFLALLSEWGQVGTACDMGLGAPGVGIEEFLHLLASWGVCFPK